MYNWKREILWWQARLEEVQFRWINRTSNRVADKLAKERIQDSKSFLFHNYVPMFIADVFRNDYVLSV